MLPVVEYWDRSFSSHLAVRGLALVRKEEGYYERAGAFRCSTLSKGSGTEMWEWLHQRERLEVKIR